jgi:hypothetical protein
VAARGRRWWSRWVVGKGGAGAEAEEGGEERAAGRRHRAEAARMGKTLASRRPPTCWVLAGEVDGGSGGGHGHGGAARLEGFGHANCHSPMGFRVCCYRT